MSEVVIGVDLGTSHSCAAWASLRDPSGVHQVGVPQPLDLHSQHSPALLASVLYFPTEDERSAWRGQRSASPEGDAGEGEHWVVGSWARQRAQETFGRSVLSAKSWLSHAAVDRTSPLLPWGSERPADVPAISPVTASARILRALKSAVLAGLGGAARAQDALWVVTVPASFDEGARQYTLQAAQQVGLRVFLLEEPQAAFYEWLASPGASEQLRKLLGSREDAQVLVIDIGGGTCDFSVLEVTDALPPTLRRGAVGKHLLLGGDNIDLALARHLQQQGLQAGGAELGALLLSCRKAKEELLADPAPESFKLTLPGRGSQLLGAARTAELSRDLVRGLVLDGFFPKVELHDFPKAARQGLSVLGLPYERDPALTRHLAEFIVRRNDGRVPDAVLFNGGVTRSRLIRERILECLQTWAGVEVPSLQSANPDLAVSRGAVRYGLALRGVGHLVESGTSSAYYLEVDTEHGSQCLCVVPKGAPSDREYRVRLPGLGLACGRTARFALLSSTSRNDAVGKLVPADAEGFVRLPPLAVHVPASSEAPSVPVEIRGKFSARGLLEVACQRLDDASAAPLDLQFDLDQAALGRAGGISSLPPRADVPTTNSPGTRAALDALERLFGSNRKSAGGDERELKDFLRNLERFLGPRKSWTLTVCRELADSVLALRKSRARSPEHERAYWMLLGFCLRPGFGARGDQERLRTAFELFPGGPRHREGGRVVEQYWIAWRRLAPGLGAAEHDAIFAASTPSLQAGSRRLALGGKPSEEQWRVASQLERLSLTSKAALGRLLIERTWTDREPIVWTHLGAVAARELAYAGPEHVLGPSTVERWVEQLLGERWAQVPTAVPCALRICRFVGDPARDLDARLRSEVARRLREEHRTPIEVDSVLNLSPPAPGALLLYGDELPLGFQLREDSASLGKADQ